MVIILQICVQKKQIVHNYSINKTINTEYTPTLTILIPPKFYQLCTIYAKTQYTV